MSVTRYLLARLQKLARVRLVCEGTFVRTRPQIASSCVVSDTTPGDSWENQAHALPARHENGCTMSRAL